MGKRRLGKRRLVATQREAWGRLVPESRTGMGCREMCGEGASVRVVRAGSVSQRSGGTRMSDGGGRDGVSSRRGDESGRNVLS